MIPKNPQLPRLLFTRAELLTPYTTRHPTASAESLDKALSNIISFGLFVETKPDSGIYETFAPRKFSGVFKRVKKLEGELNRGEEG
jgi:hypothetical protein